jgi:hypothetical protein
MRTPKATKTERARELGARINAYLKSFEASLKINQARGDRTIKPYYLAGAGGDRHRVFVRYVSFQGMHHLSVEDAERYLAWLDAGNVGKHHAASQGPRP